MMNKCELDEDFEGGGLGTTVVISHDVNNMPSSQIPRTNHGLSAAPLTSNSAVAVLKKQSVDSCEDPLSAFLTMNHAPSVNECEAMNNDNSVSTAGKVETTHNVIAETLPSDTFSTHSYYPNAHDYDKNDLFSFPSSKLPSSLASKFTFLANKAASTIQDAVQIATKGHMYPHSHSTPNTFGSVQGFSSIASSASNNNNNNNAMDGIHRSSSWNSSQASTTINPSNTWNRTSNISSSSFKGSTSTTSIVSIPEMDNEKKNAVFSSALGSSTLLQGERIIMFLSHLTFVRDSSSPRTGVGYPHSWMYDSWGNSHGAEIPNQDTKQTKDMVWCCAMTLYRLILFQYFESDFVYESDVIRNDISDDTRRIDPTHAVGKKPRHVVVQMPLASIDRLERNVLDITSVHSPTSVQGNGNAALSPFHNLSSSPISQIPHPNGGTFLCLTVYGKDNGRFIRFATSSHLDTMRAYEALNTYAFPGRRNIGYLFAFESRREEVLSTVQKNLASSSIDDSQSSTLLSEDSQLTSRATTRWFDPLVEFQRMGVIPPSFIPTTDARSQSCPWKFYSCINKNYELCSSYPSVLIGPSSVNDDSTDGAAFLYKVASFRSEGRLPVLTWCSRLDGASIWRSSQPKVGLQGNRSLADETFLKMIAEGAAASKLISNTGSTDNARSMKPSLMYLKMLTGGINDSDFFFEKGGNCLLKIMDLRPKSSAMANRTAGYGYENTSNYFNTTITFHGIGNIHAVRESYNKLSSLCTNPAVNDLFWSQLVEETKWLQFIRLILAASWQVAFHVLYNRLPVLCHCSHGWDRTSQVVCIAQILLDPYYRTRAGFACLIEKDFLAFGHPFHTRCGHGEGRVDRSSGGNTPGFDSGPGSGASDEAQMSPVFIQFLDCVFQLINQSPDDFEFNKNYIFLLSEHVYSCRFGTLICDTEKERENVASIRQRTFCLWEYLHSETSVLNPTYKSRVCNSVNRETMDEINDALMIPLPSLLRNVVLWTERHCRHGPKVTDWSCSNPSS